MVAAIRVFGPAALAADDDGDIQPSREAVGRRLLRLVFGAPESGQRFPSALADMLADPDGGPALDELARRARETFDSDPATASEAAAVIASFYRRQADAGDVDALLALGHLLYWDEPEAARAAYQQAVETGHLPALLELARVLRNVLDDGPSALAVYERAAASADADVSAEALYEIACTHLPQRDATAARVMFQRAIDTGHPVWAPAATVGLAGEMRRLGDKDAAEALYREAVETGDADWSAHASWSLGELLEDRGDAAGARAAWQPVIASANAGWAAPAFTSLVNLLSEHDDVDALRAAYQQAVELQNPVALDALEALGQKLRDRGDIEGAHAAWQEAIDAGSRQADWLRDLISPPPEPEPAPYPAGLPPEFDPGNMIRTALDVLDRGLPALPENLTRQMAVPVAYWTADQCAVVLVLRYSRHARGEPQPVVMQVTFARSADGWTVHRHIGGTSFSHDPIARPDSSRDLDGRPMVYSGTSIAAEARPGHPAVVAVGRAAPEVIDVVLIQDGREDRRRLESHFGAWVVCTDQPGPCELAGIDADGGVLARLSIPFRRPDR
jgi:tetratricopeptide (TPR) repeat protein